MLTALSMLVLISSATPAIAADVLTFAVRGDSGSMAYEGTVRVTPVATEQTDTRLMNVEWTFGLLMELISWSKLKRFEAIQFNAVVDVNTAAIRLYEDVGFVTIGVVPQAFRHPSQGNVGLRIMWLDLSGPTNQERS